MWDKQTAQTTKEVPRELDLLCYIPGTAVELQPFICGSCYLHSRRRRPFREVEQLFPMQSESRDNSSIGKTAGWWVGLLGLYDVT